jgi:putative membrane-bound dehydrogenase-like protein
MIESFRKSALVLAMLTVVVALATTIHGEDAAPAAKPENHAVIMSYRDDAGADQPVRSTAHWARRREQILSGMQQAMGTLPSRDKHVPLDVRVSDEVREAKFTRQTLSIAADDRDRIPAFLYLPNERPAGGKLPAILALHPTGELGKKIVDGQGKPNRAYARELAERGYIVLAPDYPPFGDYPCDFSDPRYASGSIKGVFNHMRCVDWLVTRDDVDPERLGVIGHSLGGHNAMFLAAFDLRIKAIVSSCGWTPFHDYYGGKLAGWAQPCYMPRIRDVYHLDADRVPFDFYEVVAAFAPRAFLSISPLADDNFEVAGVKKPIPAAEEVYRLFAAADRLQARYPDCAHDFPTAEREAAYAFFDRQLAASASAAAPADDDLSSELPRTKPLEPAEAIKSISISPGFHVELAASEPLVRSPVAIEFDERGRLFVVEMRDYSEQDMDSLGAVRLLEDSDGDGRFDKSSVYVDSLSWPTAVTCFDGGIFVGAAPDIWYCKDTDGDGRADLRKRVFTGFGRGNVQGLLNSFRWGLDNRIHGATSSAGGRIQIVDHPDRPAVDVGGRDFSFDPRSLDFRAESGGGQHGMCFDDWGRKFVCSNSDHLQLVMFEDRYFARNPRYAAPAARKSIAADGPAAEVFRTSPVEPWRIVRTRLRLAKQAPGPIEGGGRAAGYFTGATGVTVYRGNAFPKEVVGQAFIGDVGGNLVHRKSLTPDGLTLVGKRIDADREFLSSSDIWFRPAQFANAPDGCLYVVDMYREVIEHPASLPPQIKPHLDLTSGRDRGRIYKVAPGQYVVRKPPRLGLAGTSQLVARLADRNGWDRDTAARLLFERQDPAAVRPLRELARRSPLPLARMHVLHVLDGLKSLDAATLLPALGDSEAGVREHAVRLAEHGALADPAVREQLLSMANDPDLHVRYQLAFTLGELPGEEPVAALAQILTQDASDPYLRGAMFSSISGRAGVMLGHLLANADFRGSSDGLAILGQLAEQIGAESNAGELRSFEAALTSLPAAEESVTTPLVLGLVDGRSRARRPASDPLPELSPRVAAAREQLLESCRRMAGGDAPNPERIEAIRTLRIGEFEPASTVLTALLDNRNSQDIQLATIETLGRFDSPAVAGILIGAWPHLSPRLRSAASDVLFSRPKWILAVLDAIDAGQITVAEIDSARLKLLELRPDASIRDRVQRLAAKLQTGPRQEVVAAYQTALTLAADEKRGKATFQKTCSSCHRLDDVGFEIGPSLAAIKNRGPEAILLNVLDPNREVNPQYVNYIAVLNDGRTLNGIIASETATGITLKRAENATDNVQRADLEQLQSTRQSIMPEGLEKQLSQQDIADVIAYLMSLK